MADDNVVLCNTPFDIETLYGDDDDSYYTPPQIPCGIHKWGSIAWTEFQNQIIINKIKNIKQNLGFAMERSIVGLDPSIHVDLPPNKNQKLNYRFQQNLISRNKGDQIDENNLLCSVTKSVASKRVRVTSLVQMLFHHQTWFCGGCGLEPYLSTRSLINLTFTDRTLLKRLFWVTINRMTNADTKQTSKIGILYVADARHFGRVLDQQSTLKKYVTSADDGQPVDLSKIINPPPFGTMFNHFYSRLMRGRGIVIKNPRANDIIIGKKQPEGVEEKKTKPEKELSTTKLRNIPIVFSEHDQTVYQFQVPYSADLNYRLSIESLQFLARFSHGGVEVAEMMCSSNSYTRWHIAREDAPLFPRKLRRLLDNQYRVLELFVDSMPLTPLLQKTRMQHSSSPFDDWLFEHVRTIHEKSQPQESHIDKTNEKQTTIQNYCLYDEDKKNRRRQQKNHNSSKQQKRQNKRINQPRNRNNRKPSF